MKVLGSNLKDENTRKRIFYQTLWNWQFKDILQPEYHFNPQLKIILDYKKWGFKYMTVRMFSIWRGSFPSPYPCVRCFPPSSRKPKMIRKRLRSVGDLNALRCYNTCCLIHSLLSRIGKHLNMFERCHVYENDKSS